MAGKSKTESAPVVVQQKGGGWYQLPSGKKIHGRKNVEEAWSLAQQDKRVANDFGVDPAFSGVQAGRLRFLRTAGLQYQGARDIYTAAGYIPQGTERFDDYWALYERDPIAARIVDMIPKTTWRTPPTVYAAGADPEKPGEFQKAWDKFADSMHVWRHLERVDRMSRIGRYAVLVFGMKAGTDAELQQDLTGTKYQASDLMYFASYVEKYAKINTWVVDPRSPRFGLPDQYGLTLSSAIADFPTRQIVIHASRVIHICEDSMGDEVFGRPALKRALNALADMMKVTASTGEAYWQLASRILQGEIDPNSDIDDADVKVLGNQLEEIVHDLRRQFLGQGTKLSWLDSTPPDPKNVLEAFETIIAIATGIPKRIFFGSERGELASNVDERTYFGMVNERQEHHAEPVILRPFINKLIDMGILPNPGEAGYTVDWPSQFELSEKELADSNWRRAEAAKSLTPLGGDPRELVTIDSSGNVTLKQFTPADLKDLTPPALPEPPANQPAPDAGVPAAPVPPVVNEGGPGKIGTGVLERTRKVTRTRDGYRVEVGTSQSLEVSRTPEGFQVKDIVAMEKP